MTQEISPGTVHTTEALIKSAFATVERCRLIREPAYLDDEQLPESERLRVLREIFNRNIRITQLNRLAHVLAPVLGGTHPPNVLIYGPSGTGKSVTCLHFLTSLQRLCGERCIPFDFCYVDLTTPKSCFGALNELAIALDDRVRRYRKGVALEQMQERIIEVLRERSGFLAVLVDEADNVSREVDVFMTLLVKTLPKKVPVRIFYLFLTNRMEWEKTLDPRILSVLKKHDLIFEPYAVEDLVSIIELRVEKSLNTERVDPAAIRKIAALACRETGDARKAVELLAKAVNIGQETSGRLTVEEVDAAESRLEVDKTQELIAALAVQQRVALEACYRGLVARNRKLNTGDAYEVYLQVCRERVMQPLTQRRFADMISFLDVYGLINAPVISKGRFGKTREVSRALPENVIKKLVQPA